MVVYRSVDFFHFLTSRSHTNHLFRTKMKLSLSFTNNTSNGFSLMRCWNILMLFTFQEKLNKRPRKVTISKQLKNEHRILKNSKTQRERLDFLTTICWFFMLIRPFLIKKSQESFMQYSLPGLAGTDIPFFNEGFTEFFKRLCVHFYFKFLSGDAQSIMIRGAKPFWMATLKSLSFI